jgi:hypothetical protein
MRRNAENTDDVDLCIMEKILRSLNLKLDHVVVEIEKSKDLKKLIMKELMGSLQAGL